MTEQYLDGNALAGPLSEIFAIDVTAAARRCAACGLTGPLAGLRLYVRAPGLVAKVIAHLERGVAGVEQQVLRRLL